MLANKKQEISADALRTLKYWTPGDHAGNSDSYENLEDHDSPALDGLRECMDFQLLYYVSDLDKYRPTRIGRKQLARTNQ